MNHSNDQLMIILKSSLSDIIAGFILLMISILVYLDMFSILRNPIFSGILALIFLYLAAISSNPREYPDTKNRLLNLDLNAVIVGVSLLVVSILGIVGRFEVTRYFLLPLIPGLLLMAVAISRLYLKASNSSVTIERIDPCGIVGGEALVLYSLLLYMDMTSIAWSPIFPLLISIVLYTALFIDIIPLIRSNQTGMENTKVWLSEIDEKIIFLRHEFESIKSQYDDPRVNMSLERISAIQASVAKLREINESLKTDAATINNTKYTESINIPPTTTPSSIKPETDPSEIATEMKSNDLEDRVGIKTSDEIFYENILKEFDMHEMSDIIKEARELRKSINIRKKD